MKRRAESGFTLMELMVVMVIIAIIAGLVMGVAGITIQKGNRSRAQGEIAGMTAAAERYKTDNGDYPRQDTITEDSKGDVPPIDPRRDGDPTTKKYEDASKFLYGQLSGDSGLNLKPGANGEKSYMTFTPGMIEKTTGGTKGTEVLFIKDPFGYSYGYSTQAMRMNELYKERLAAEKNPDAKKGLADIGKDYGYNRGIFDLWSTGGLKKDLSSNADTVHAKWVKNW